ncbi:hypothetical protein E3N88_38371 [Mikania micrantha]|uniref:DDE Tnp4 domain-containing protein n=1 Tax=Mikania micrantha TaxID=192012 RepID=A0A5N6LTU7_9ASTR|nr:hypothetical protein E3N88_38371 [Mikania micrantha]
MEFLREDDDFSEGEDFLIEAAQLTLDIIRQQKCTSAIRQLAYGTSSDSFDEYLQMSERMGRECIYKFCKCVIRLYAKKYLRKPNSHDIQQIYTFHEEVYGFLSMLGSLDCTHWEWDNCPTAWRDLWIYHAFFGASGSNNDINVLHQSPIYNDLIEGKVPGQQFICNDTTYKYGYYLVDGIYPQWATLVKSFTSRQTEDEKRLYFQNRQEGARKDIEQAFGVLKHKWHMIQHPANAWKPSRIRNALYACVILHNMIIEDNGRAICEFYEEDDPNLLEHVEINDEEKQANRRLLRNEDTHANLKADLIEHLWKNRFY